MQVSPALARPATGRHLAADRRVSARSPPRPAAAVWALDHGQAARRRGGISIAVVGARDRLLPRRGVRRAPAVPKQAHTLSLTEVGLVLGLFFASPAACWPRRSSAPRVALSRPPAPAAGQARLQPRRAVALHRYRAARLPLASRRRPESVQRRGASPARGRRRPHGRRPAGLRGDRGRRGELRGAPAAPDARVSLVGALATACLGLAAVDC